jgi:hypothetical protein
MQCPCQGAFSDLGLEFGFGIVLCYNTNSMLSDLLEKLIVMQLVEKHSNCLCGTSKGLQSVH